MKTRYSIWCLITATAPLACGLPETAEETPPPETDVLTRAHLAHWFPGENGGCGDPHLYDASFVLSWGQPSRTFLTVANDVSYWEDGNGDSEFTFFSAAGPDTPDNFGISHTTRVNQLTAKQPYWIINNRAVTFLMAYNGRADGVSRNSAVVSHHNALCNHTYIVKAMLASDGIGAESNQFQVRTDLIHTIRDQDACTDRSGAAVPWTMLWMYVNECPDFPGGCQTKIDTATRYGQWSPSEGRCFVVSSLETHAPVGWRTNWIEAVVQAGVGHVAGAASVTIERFHLIEPFRSLKLGAGSGGRSGGSLVSSSNRAEKVGSATPRPR